MDIYFKKLHTFIKQHLVNCEHLFFEQSCHSVLEAAETVGADESDFVKNICFLDASNHLVVAIVRGVDRVSSTKLGKLLNSPRPRAAGPDEILQLTGYPCGGTPSFGFDAKFLIDLKVMEKSYIYTGGGSEKSLVKISPNLLPKLNKGEIVSIRK